MLKKVCRAILPPIIWRGLSKAKHALQPQRPLLFDGDGAEFQKLISDCKVYAEYGCGLSTKYVLEHTNAEVYAVDSSKEWVNRTIADNRGNSRLFVHWADMGEVEDWGRPVSYEKRNAFIDYTNWIWSQEVTPDVILVDGRFRVACFLTCLLESRSSTIIIFDDYRERKFYHIVEEIVPVSYFHGRQAIFLLPESMDIDVELVKDMLEKFRYVMD